MGFVVILVLLEGGFVGMKDRSLGCMRRRKIAHDVSIIRNHGFGLSCGISLRRRSRPLSLA